MRYVFLAAVAAVSLCGQSVSTKLSITNYQVVSQEPAGPGSWRVTYRADLLNSGEALTPLRATLSSLDANSIETVPGKDLLNFDSIPARAQVASTNTFTVLVSRTHRFRTADLHWTFEPADVSRLNKSLPLANAGTGKTVKVGSPVTLNARGSTLPGGGGRLKYNWTFSSRPPGSSAALSDPDSAMPSFVADVPGDYTLALTVANGAATSRSAVTISTANSAPVANAGRNKTVATGSTVNLNGGASTDVDGNSLTYSWRLIAKPADSSATLTSANTLTPSFVVDKSGAYTAELIVNDGHADSVASTVTISTANSVPVANAGADLLAPPGSTVRLDGSGSTDVDGDELTYAWTLISAPDGSIATLDDPTAVNPSFTPDVPGLYIAQLIVSDATSSGIPTTVVISTSAMGQPRASAGLNQTAQPNATVQLNGSGTDPQNLPLSHQWSLISVPAGSKAALSRRDATNPTFETDQPGTYVAQLMVANGNSASAPSTVEVTTTNTPPVANAGTNKNVTAGVPVSLDGSGSSDADHDPLTFSWSFVSKPPGSAATLSNPTTVTPSFVPDVAGPYVVQLIVNDGKANSDPATVTITASTPTASLSLTPASQDLAPDSQGTLVVQLPSAASSGDVVVSLLNSSGCFPGSCVAELPPGNTVTIRQGFFGTTIPVRGHDIGSTSITAVAPGYAPAKAVVNVVQPTITLTLASPAVGFGSTVTGTITLSAPAGVEGVPVNLTATAGVTVDPATVTIPIGSKTGTFTITGGFTPTTSKITASSPGYPTATINVTVGSRGQIVLQSGITLGTGQSMPIAVNLATFAGSDVVITLASSDSSKVTISPATVTIPAGHNTPVTQPQVTGVDFGSANITATSSGYIGTSASVTVGGALSFSKPTYAVGAGGTQNLTVNLSSPAPAEGVTVVLVSSNQSVATVVSPVTIAPGTLSATVPATGVAPGFTNISATTTAPNVTGATATVNVVNAGTIILPANVTVGPGQSVPFPVTISPAAPAGGVTITLASSNSNIATISTTTLTIGAGQTTSATIPQVTGVNFGMATISATANGYTGGSQNVTVGAAFTLTPQNTTISPGGNEILTLNLSAAAPANLQVTLTSSSPGVASVTSPITIPAGSQTASVSVTGVGVGGPVTITASAPGIASGSATVTVGTNGVINFPTSLSVAAGASVQVPLSLSVAPAQPGVTVSLTSNNPGAATVSPSAIFIGPGQTVSGVPVTINGVAPGTSTVTASAAGYNLANMAVTVVPPNTISFTPLMLTMTAGAIQNLTLNLSTPAPAGGLTLMLASSNPNVVTVPSTFPVPPNATTALIPITGVSAGIAAITGTAAGVTGTAMSTITVVFGSISVACPTVGPGQTMGCTVTLSAIPRGAVTVALTSDNTNTITVIPTVTIPNGSTSTNQALITGVNFGSANISAAASGWTPGSTQATVMASVSFTPQTLSMRQGTTQSLTLSLSGPAPAGGVTVNLSSDNTNVATVPPTATFAPGALTTLVPVTGVGLGQATIHANNLPSISDASAVVTVSSLPDIILPTGVTVLPGLSATFLVTLKNPAPPADDHGVPTCNVGGGAQGGGAIVTLTTSNPAIVTLNHGKTTINIAFAPCQTTPVSQPVVDGVNFGSATITGADASLGGLSGDTETVTVAASLAFFPANLMLAPSGGAQRVALSVTPAAPAGGLTVSLSSDNPAVASVPSTAFFPAGFTSVSVPITPGTSGATLIHASSLPNIPDTTLSVTVGSAGLNLPSNVTVAPGQSVPFPIMISPVAPSGGVTVNLSTSDSTIATITPSVFIQQGQVSPATQPQLTGVNFGSANITGTAPGYGSATQPVKVGSALAFNPPTGTVAAGQTANLNLTLSVPAPGGGITVNLMSSNTGAATVPASVFLSSGATSVQVPVTGVNQGTAVITASTNSPNVSSANATVTVGNCTANCGTPQPLTITTTSLPSVPQGQPYSATLNATGGSPPYFWNASALPNGLSIVANQIVGTTSLAPSSRNVTISVSDSGSPAMSTQAHLVLTIVPPNATVTVATTSLPTGNVGSPYTAPLSATGGTGNYTFSATGLPGGLSVTGSQITGTPQAAFNGSVTITATDTASASGSKVLTLIINPPALQITTSSLPGGTSNQPYSSGPLNATGGTPPYTWTATGLPNGLAVNGNTIMGTTSASCTPCSVTLFVKDSASPANTASTTLPLNITGQLNLITNSLPTGAQFAPYTAPLSASGGTGALSFTATGLPAGLNVVGTQITGSPQVAFNGPVTITVSDSAAPPTSVSKTLQLVINPQLAVTTTSLPNGTINVPYSAPLGATGGNGNYIFSATGLPNGLTVSGSQIVGTPTVGFNGNVTINVTDSFSPANSASKTLALVINSPLAITTASLNTGTVGQAYSSPLAAVGGTGPYTFTASGLPNGLGVSGSQITGTPTVAFNGNVTITVTDSASPQGSVSKTLSLTIAPPMLTITTTSLNGGTQGVAYSTPLAASGGTQPYTFSATGLPAGLSVSGSQIVGTPTAACSPSCAITISVTDSSSPQLNAQKTLTLTIAPVQGGGPLTITQPTTLPDAMLMTPYSVNLAATGGTGPYSWAASGLPTGLNVVGSTITGTPTQVVTNKNVIIQVTDSASPANTARVNLTITVTQVVMGTCVPITVTGASVGQNLQTLITVSLGRPPVGNATVNLSSSDPSKVLMALRQTQPGAGTLGGPNAPFIPAGSSSSQLFVQGVALGSSIISATTTAVPTLVNPNDTPMPYCTGMGTINVTPSGFVFAGPNGTGKAFVSFSGAATPLSVSAAQLDANNNFVQIQQLSASALGGVGSATVNIASTNPGSGTVSPASVVFPPGVDTVTTTVPPCSGVGSTCFIAANVNVDTTTTLSATAPAGFSTAAGGANSLFVDVEPPGFMNPPNVIVGNGLEASATVSLNGTAPGSSTCIDSVSGGTVPGITIVLSANSPSFQLSPTATGAGSSSITVCVASGRSVSRPFFIYGLANSGTATYTATASSGFGSATGNVTLAPSGVGIAGPSGNPGAAFTTTVGQPSNLTISTGILDGSGNFIAPLNVAGGGSVNVNLNSGNTSIGTVAPGSVSIPGGASSNTATFTAVSAGTDVVSVNVPSGFSTTTASSLAVTVQAPSFAIADNLAIGLHLQSQATLTAGLPAGAGGLIVTLMSNNPNLLISASPTAQGSTTAQVTIPAGGKTATYYLQSNASSGTAGYSVSASGFATKTATNITFGPSGFVIIGPNGLAGGNANALVQKGIQIGLTIAPAVLDANNLAIGTEQLAGGQPSVTVTASLGGGVGTLTPPTVVIPAGSPGVDTQFSSQAVGHTTVTITSPSGYTKPAGVQGSPLPTAFPAGPDPTMVNISVTP